MGLRERIEDEIRAALAAARKADGTGINVASRVNRVVVGNVGGGHAAASAEQVAPIVQEPVRDPGQGTGHHGASGPGGPPAP